MRTHIVGWDTLFFLFYPILGLLAKTHIMQLGLLEERKTKAIFGACVFCSRKSELLFSRSCFLHIALFSRLGYKTKNEKRTTEIKDTNEKDERSSDTQGSGRSNNSPMGLESKGSCRTFYVFVQTTARQGGGWGGNGFRERACR